MRCAYPRYVSYRNNSSDKREWHGQFNVFQPLMKFSLVIQKFFICLNPRLIKMILHTHIAPTHRMRKRHFVVRFLLVLPTLL